MSQSPKKIHTPSEAPKGAHQITIKDVAAAVGVSHTTVSLALRGSSKITERRRKQVIEAAERLGYRMNPMGAGLAHFRALSRHRPIQSTIAWLNYWRRPEELRAFREFDLYWRGAEDAALRWGYRLEEFREDPERSPERLTQILHTRNVRGILIPPHGRPHYERFKHALSLDWSRFAVVRFGYTVPALKVSVVATDQVANMRIALERLREKKYRRIGFVTHEGQTSRALEGFMGEWIRHPVRQQVRPLQLPDSGKAWPQTFSAWMAKQRPDAIITDLACVRDWLAAAEFQGANPIAVAAMSVLDGAAETGIDQKSYEIGKAAVDVLISRIHNENFGETETCREILVQGRWVEGETVP